MDFCFVKLSKLSKLTESCLETERDSDKQRSADVLEPGKAMSSFLLSPKMRKRLVSGALDNNYTAVCQLVVRRDEGLRTQKQKEVLLTRAQLASEAQAVEIVTLTVFAPHLTELSPVAGALSAHTVPSSTADVTPSLLNAVHVIGRTVVALCALTVRAQAPRVTLTHTALVGPVAIIAHGAVGHGVSLAVTFAGKVHCDSEGILKAPRFDGKSAVLVLGAATQLCLHAERHLGRKTVICLCVFHCCPTL